MNEQQIKLICKLAVENSKRPFTDTEKELLKQAIDQAKSWDDLLEIALSTFGIQ